MERDLFSFYLERVLRLPGGATVHPSVLIGSKGRHSLYYTPFEHVNHNAELVIVGITPGPKQLQLAYEIVKQSAARGVSDTETLIEVKRAALGGKSVRPNLLRMMGHFGFADLLGVTSEAALWNEAAGKLHSTSVVPHAAFKHVNRQPKMFAGSFEDIRKSPLLRECFEDCFVPSLREINPRAYYIGLGPTPLDALRWCVRRGLLRKGQLLGAFAHPSTGSGSQVDYFLREKRRDSLHPRDPVRHRCDWLDAAYGQMAAAIEKMR